MVESVIRRQHVQTAAGKQPVHLETEVAAISDLFEALIGFAQSENLATTDEVDEKVASVTLMIVGEVATYSNIATLAGSLTESDKNKAWLCLADRRLYVWDGAAFPASGSGILWLGKDGNDAVFHEVQSTQDGIDWSLANPGKVAWKAK